MCDLMDWALSQARSEEKWSNSIVGTWNEDAERFFKGIAAFDGYLASGAKLHRAPEQLFQGAIADALTHTGQIAMLRRMAGSRVMGENYSRAKIEIGRTGAEQAKPEREF